jgi:phosphatidylglycerol:prolipoprotein diacylglycerol transferase
MTLLLVLAHKFSQKLKAGDLFLIYLTFYSFGRFLLEYVRIDYSPIAGLNINQTLMGVVFVASIVGLALRHLLKRAPIAE